MSEYKPTTYVNNEYNDLLKHYSNVQNTDFYKVLSGRKNAADYSLETDFLILDFNRNLITDDTLTLLGKFLDSKNFSLFRNHLFNGGIANITENKSADHIALRNTENNLFSGDKNLIENIKKSLKQIENITQIVHSKQASATIIGDVRHVVHIGLGGSDLGPRLVVDALDEFKNKSAPDIYFINNVDPYQIDRVLRQIDLERTLFVIVSKSFKTPEILLIKQVLLDRLKQSEIDSVGRIVAVSSNLNAVKSLNIPPENFLFMPDTIGGRYSVWSPTGLVISLYIGYDGFTRLLNGASNMDKHFKDHSALNNIPVILALLEFWYVSFFRSEFSTVNPYTERLQLLPFFLQQLQMESNGKSTDIEGNPVNYPTAPAIMGGTGTPCQHSYFQALHQGKHTFHAEFIAVLQTPDHNANKKCYDFLYSSMLAQAHTMLAGYSSSETEIVPQHKVISGNKPCNLILIKKWNPESLGSLLAAYEHKTAVLGLLWQIDSFDQWGVERGKKICSEIEDYITGENDNTSFIDPANAYNIKLYLKNL